MNTNNIWIYLVLWNNEINPQIVNFGFESQLHRNQPMVSGGMSKTICKSEKVLYCGIDNSHGTLKIKASTWPTTCIARIHTVNGQYRRISPDLHIGLWCNGNTQDFGPCVLGSSPGSPTKLSSLTYWYNKIKNWFGRGVVENPFQWDAKQPSEIVQ